MLILFNKSFLEISGKNLKRIGRLSPFCLAQIGGGGVHRHSHCLKLSTT